MNTYAKHSIAPLTTGPGPTEWTRSTRTNSHDGSWPAQSLQASGRNTSQGAGTAALSEESPEQELSLRWRRALLRLSANLEEAARRHSHLAPVLDEALAHALDQLVRPGGSDYLDDLEAWLNADTVSPATAPSAKAGASTGRAPTPWTGPERRAGRERRRG